MYDLKTISSQRGFIYGIATLWIVLFHSPLLSFDSVGALGTFIDFFNAQDVGVDIFLFMSGISMYFSFSKDSNLKSFYTKRVLRIIPPAMLVALITCIMDKEAVGFTIKRTLLISFFTDYDLTFWYVSLILILYCLYPLIHKLFAKKGFVAFLLLTLIVVGLTYLLITSSTYFASKQVALSRIPVFLTGAYFGKFVKHGFAFKGEKLLYIFLVTMALFAGILVMGWEHQLALRWIYCPLSVCLTILYSFVGSKIGKITTPFVFLGKYSLEVYLMHSFAYLYISARVPLWGDSFGILYSAAIFALIIPLAMLLSKITSLVTCRVF